MYIIMMKKEAGEKPARSRRRNRESLFKMPLYKREGE